MPDELISSTVRRRDSRRWARASLVLAFVALASIMVVVVGIMAVSSVLEGYEESAAILVLFVVAPFLAIGLGIIPVIGLIVAIVQSRRRRRGTVVAIVIDSLVLVLLITVGVFTTQMLTSPPSTSRVAVGEPRAMPGSEDALPVFDGAGVAELVEANAWTVAGNTDHGDEIAIGAVLQAFAGDVVYYDAWVDVELLDADGEVVATERDIVALTPGRPSVVDVTFLARTIPEDVTETVISVADYHLSHDARTAPASDAGEYEIDDVTTVAEDGAAVVRGTLTSTTRVVADADVALVIRNGEGQIVHVRPDTVYDVPAQASVEYAEDLGGMLPRHSTVDVYVGPSPSSPTE